MSMKHMLNKFLLSAQKFHQGFLIKTFQPNSPNVNEYDIQTAAYINYGVEEVVTLCVIYIYIKL